MLIPSQHGVGYGPDVDVRRRVEVAAQILPDPGMPLAGAVVAVLGQDELEAPDLDDTIPPQSVGFSLADNGRGGGNLSVVMSQA